MGTSADYGGPVGGGWTSYKRAVSNFARHGGENGKRAQRVVSRYVAADSGCPQRAVVAWASPARDRRRSASYRPTMSPMDIALRTVCGDDRGRRVAAI